MRIVAHLDMDAFFSSVEERDNIRFKGRPIVVGSDPRAGRGRGVVSTANYKARVYGICSATPISIAWEYSELARKRGDDPVIFLGVDMEKYEKNGLITLIQQSIAPRKLMSIATPLALIKSKNVKRVVLDSITLFEYTYVSGVPEFRKEILDFVLKMKEANVTLVTVSEKSVMNIDGFEYKPEDFLFEGLILLTKVRKGSSYEFCLSVMKMRGQDHSLDIFPYKIGQGGMTVFPKEIPFSLIERDIKKK